jgi:uncharacterized protein YbjT (DUF2867 family)
MKNASKGKLEVAMYVVTGATGNTGGVAARRLLANGEKVRVVGRNADRLQALANLGAEPFIADLSDANALTRALNGARAAYLMIPPDMGSTDFRSFQARVTDAFATALTKSGIKHAVALSSIGAGKPEKTGPVVGLYSMEQKLNGIAGLNILYLRPGYFMENTLGQVGIIHALGKIAAPLRKDLRLPMIATRDIGEFAANALQDLKFAGKQTRELLGQRDLTYNEATAIIGKAIDKPNLQYVQMSAEQIRPAMLQIGMSGNIADLILEMSASLNSGHMGALEKRSSENTTPTSFETFVKEQFLPVYEGKQQAA